MLVRSAEVRARPFDERERACVLLVLIGTWPQADWKEK